MKSRAGETDFAARAVARAGFSFTSAGSTGWLPSQEELRAAGSGNGRSRGGGYPI